MKNLCPLFPAGWSDKCGRMPRSCMSTRVCGLSFSPINVFTIFSHTFFSQCMTSRTCRMGNFCRIPCQHHTDYENILLLLLSNSLSSQNKTKKYSKTFQCERGNPYERSPTLYFPKIRRQRNLTSNYMCKYDFHLCSRFTVIIEDNKQRNSSAFLKKYTFG